MQEVQQHVHVGEVTMQCEVPMGSEWKQFPENG